ncbi:MAG TPA: hypothetical protein EYQ54_06975 [Myxococcales bacterium]|nr:hypothetical protein [Myxococcales bacterium]HIL80382.1 hypothetical protein [Myxococcales bacterium]
MRGISVWISIAFFALFLATGIAADTKSLNGRRGEGIVDKVNAGSRTIMVNLQEYSVPLDCKINRASGEIVPLAKLRGAMRPGKNFADSSEVDFVVFEAVKNRSGWAMTKIRLLDEVPE